MPYQSPLHILDSLHIAPDELTSVGITRLRKKLLAEFSLTTDITIDVSGQFYTKDEILKIIDQLKELDNLVLHKAIFSRKPLLNWLENPQNYFFPLELAKEVLDENLESDFYQNTLQTSMSEYVKVHFRKRHFVRQQMAIDFLSNLQEEYQYNVYDVLYAEIQIIIEEIEYAQKKPNIRENRESFGFISEPQWTDFLNNLPENFEETREAYCYAAVNYTVVIQRKDREWTYDISAQLDQILCEGSIRDTIRSNHLIYTENYHGTVLEEKSKSWSGWIWIVFMVVRFLFYANSCSNHSSSNRDSYSNPQTYTNSFIPNKQEYDIKTPPTTFYIQQIQNFQKTLVKNAYSHDGQKINIMLGEDILSNLNVGNKEEIVDSKDKINLQTTTFKNQTDYDVVILKAGCIANRSYYVKSKDTYWIESCQGDKFYFYFGKEWRQIYAKSSMTNLDEGKRFQGYFSEPHKNTNSVFMKEYTVILNTGNPNVILYNVMLEHIIGPQIDGLQLREYDTSIILQ